MKLAAAVDSQENLKPLDQGERIVFIESAQEEPTQTENPGYGYAHGGKELAMEVILDSGADAVVVKEGFLCPCSYTMSKGRLKYVIVHQDNLTQLRSGFDGLVGQGKEELEEELYAEEDDHHGHEQPPPRRVNASFGS